MTNADDTATGSISTQAQVDYDVDAPPVKAQIVLPPAIKQLGLVKRTLKEVRFFLVSFKVLFVSLIIFNVTTTYNMIIWFQNNHQLLSEAAAAGYIGILMVLLANIKWAMEKAVD